MYAIKGRPFVGFFVQIEIMMHSLWYLFLNHHFMGAKGLCETRRVLYFLGEVQTGWMVLMAFCLLRFFFPTSPRAMNGSYIWTMASSIHNDDNESKELSVRKESEKERERGVN